MKKIIKNKRFFALLFCFLVSWICTAEAAMTRLALYGQAKYPENFTHFEYVNPEAPQGGRMVMPEYGSFDSFNPFTFKGSASGIAADLIWDSLGFSPVDDMSVVYPLLAKAFEFPEDHTYVGFILDERAQFADGTPVLADDVIFSFKALVEKGAPIYRVYYGDVERVEKINDRHVRFIFKENSQNKELPLILSQLKIFPRNDWENRDFSKPSLQIPLGSGPYEITDFEAGKYIILKRRRDYWGNNLPVRRGFYNFDEIRLDYYQDTTVTLQALFAGNIDVREEYIAKIWATGYDKPWNIIIRQFCSILPLICAAQNFRTKGCVVPLIWLLTLSGRMINCFIINISGFTVILPTAAWKQPVCLKGASLKSWNVSGIRLMKRCLPNRLFCRIIQRQKKCVPICGRPCNCLMMPVMIL